MQSPFSNENFKGEKSKQESNHEEFAKLVPSLKASKLSVAEIFQLLQRA